MNFTLNKISYDKSIPIFSSEPVVCVKLSGMAIIDNNGADGVLWDAYLPVTDNPEPENITITRSRLIRTGEVVDDVDEFINSHSDFLPVRELLCEYFLKHVSTVQLYRVLLENKSNPGPIRVIPVPLFVESHDKGFVYLSENNKDAGVKLHWSYDLMRERAVLLRIEYGASEVVDSKHALRIVSDFYPAPDIDSFSVDFIQASNLINYADSLILNKQGLDDVVSVAYKRGGQCAEARHIITLGKDELTMVWDIERDDAALRPTWSGNCNAIEFIATTLTGACESRLKIDALPFGFSSILQEYSLDKVLRQMDILNPSKAGDIVADTLRLVSAGKGLDEYFSLVNLDFVDFERTTIVSHTVACGINYIRTFWRVESSVYYGFQEFVRAKITLDHVKFEGVKSSYFPNSQSFTKIIDGLPDGFFGRSADEVRRYLLEAHEYFYMDAA